MRCPECRHRARPARWWRLPEVLSCYGCGAKLKRVSRLSVGEAFAVWMLIMLPGAAIAYLGGVGGFVLGAVLAMTILPLRPWRGLRYQLGEGAVSRLPVARALASRPPVVAPAEQRDTH